MEKEAPKTITLDGVEHEVNSFSDEVKKLVAIHTIWQSELMKERLAVAKTESAVRATEAELVKTVQAELKAKAEAEAKTEPETKTE